MDRYKYVKEIIGYLIGYYRKKSSINIRNFIVENNENNNLCKQCNQCQFNNIICPKSTYNRLENGNAINKDCTYQRLANKLGKKVILNNYEIYNHIEVLRNELKKSIIDFSKSRLLKLKSYIELDLIKYENVLYIEEILSIYLNIIQNILYSTDIDSKKGQIYLFLRDKVQFEDEKMISFLIYLTNFRILDLYGTIDVINEQCGKYYDDDLFYEAKLDSILYTNLMNLLDSYNYLVNNELKKISELTKYQQYQLFSTIASAEMNLEAYEKCYHTYKKANKLLNEFDSTENMKSGIYRCLGRTCYLLRKYEEVVVWLKQARNIKKSKSISQDYLFLLSSLEKTNKISELKELIKEIDISKIISKYGKQIISYYKLKYSKDLLEHKKIVELEDFIINLKPTLDIYGSLHKNVFDEDIKYYVTITGNYKKYLIFIENNTNVSK